MFTNIGSYSAFSYSFLFDVLDLCFVSVLFTGRWVLVMKHREPPAAYFRLNFDSDTSCWLCEYLWHALLTPP